MSTVVVLGGGVVGLCTARMLSRRGVDVVVLEKDGAGVPGSAAEAWEAWDRTGVAQFRLAHYLMPGARDVLRTELPEVLDALLQADCAVVDVMAHLPPGITDTAPRDGDDRFVTVTGRRPVVEYAVASAVGEHVDVRRGVRVTGLVTGPSLLDGVPHVTGVRLASGEEIAADLVVDAGGRRSALPRWLADLGAREVPEEAEDSGFIYYGRFFAAPDGSESPLGGAVLGHFDCYSLLALPGDARTWSVTVYLSSHDTPLKELRHLDRWTTLVEACPQFAPLLGGSPLGGIEAMSGGVDRRRRFVVDGTPVATGVVAVGDAWACTNPSLGRGISIGLKHAAGTADVVAEHLDDPLALVQAHDRMTEERVTPWHEGTLAVDRARRAQVTACIEGRELPRPDTPAGQVARALETALLYDPDVFRAAIEIRGVLSPVHEVMVRPGLVERILATASGRDAVVPQGPSRREVLAMVS